MNSVQLLDRLVSFATVSRDSNLGLIDFTRDFLAGFGVESRLYRDPTGKKANLYATVGPIDRGGVLLSGHSDVVPAAGQPWSSEPFKLVDRAGRLQARGAADMKGFLACALAAAQRASQRDLSTPLHLAFSYDEEVGCLGVRSLIDDMQSWAHLPKFCIIGEPTLLRTAIGHKGKMAIKATCHGQPAHSANPSRGINAIYMASELIASVRECGDQMQSNGARDEGYEVPHTTLHVGTIRGGSALNIVPDRCELEMEIRHLAADDPHELLSLLRARARDIAQHHHSAVGACGIDLEVSNEYPGLDTSPDSDIVEWVAQLTGHRDCIKVGFGSEGGLFSEKLKIPTVVCGPGSIEQAHKADEYIDINQMDRCDAMLDLLLDRLV